MFALLYVSSQLTTWLGTLLWDTPSVQVFRVKGVVSIAGEDCKHVLQGVNELFDCQPCHERWPEEQARVTKVGWQLPRVDGGTTTFYRSKCCVDVFERRQVVFIGRRLHKETLTEGLASCGS